MMKKFCAIFLSATAATAILGSPAAAARNPMSASGPETQSNVSDLRVPDPQKELRHLSKDLKLKKDQRADVNIILQERAREIHLLLDIEFLSQENRNTLAAKVMEDSDAQIEAVLGSKQKIKFDKELTKDRDLR
jgi:hypothetical protein